ncbi:unnamed protein product [Toxocara canis]|uniref:Uncharacterized protein n=1 Tax=Toxocara canis TaxID=6265 RepID=A0A183V8E6_TOXCA|nr:unnamed protein product [Toxocara canis]
MNSNPHEVLSASSAKWTFVCPEGAVGDSINSPQQQHRRVQWRVWFKKQVRGHSSQRSEDTDREEKIRSEVGCAGAYVMCGYPRAYSAVAG